jgi:hypothetical protein
MGVTVGGIEIAGRVCSCSGCDFESDIFNGIDFGRLEGAV